MSAFTYGVYTYTLSIRACLEDSDLLVLNEQG
jgi:hypothetical protein